MFDILLVLLLTIKENYYNFYGDEGNFNRIYMHVYFNKIHLFTHVNIANYMFYDKAQIPNINLFYILRDLNRKY